MIQPFDLNLRHLRAVDAIRARGSMSAGADAVSLSQPALTQGLAKLEQRLGVRLFERHAEGMRPTAEGDLLARRVRAAFGHLAAAARGIGRGRGFARPEELMTATQLRAFLALADAGGFAAAGAATGLSQPALHRAVRDLEQLCAVPLAERRGRGVALTPAASRLARGARLAAGEIAAAIEEIRPQDHGRGRIVVGAMPFSRALILPRAIARFTRELPGAQVEVVEGSWRELVDPLRDGVLDLMIGALRPEPPRDLAQEPLTRDRLHIIARREHPLAGSAAPRIEDLAAYPWIIGQAGTPLRGQWEALFTGVPLPAAPIVCGSASLIREILHDSDFLTLLSRDQVATELACGMLATIGGALEASSRLIGITMRETWNPTAAQARFVAVVRDAVEHRLPENL